jgi:hypothetical protein
VTPLTRSPLWLKRPHSYCVGFFSTNRIQIGFCQTSRHQLGCFVVTVSMALCVASRCLHEYYGMMMEGDQQEDVATWYIFYSDKENREYYYQPQTNTASWVLPKGARISPNDDTDNTLEDTNEEGSTPRESGPGFRDDVDDNVIDLTETSFKSFARRFVALVTGYRFGMVLLLLNVFLSSSYIGSILLSNNNSVLNVETPEPTTATPSMAKIAVVAEQVLSEQRLPIPECIAPVSVPAVSEEKEPQSGLFGDLFRKPTEASEHVKEAAQKAASKGNEILQRIEGTVESAGYPIVTRYSNANANANQLVVETRVAEVEPCRRPLSRLFSKECRQTHREQQQASTDSIAPGVRVQAAMDEGLLLVKAAGKNVVRILSAPRAPWYPKVED